MNDNLLLKFLAALAGVDTERFSNPEEPAPVKMQPTRAVAKTVSSWHSTKRATAARPRVSAPSNDRTIMKDTSFSQSVVVLTDVGR